VIPSALRSPPRAARFGAALALLLAAIALLGAGRGVPSSGWSAAQDAPALNPLSPSTPEFALSVSAQPTSICAFGSTDCSADAGESRVTLTAQAPSTGEQTWPAVQLAFVINTAAYNGDWDPSYAQNSSSFLLNQADPCADTGFFTSPPASPLCEESNLIPFFVSNAESIATGIASANPTTQVTFALVDYFAAWDQFDDETDDGQHYDVDISSFVPASQFGAEVQSTFVATQLTGMFDGGAGRGFIGSDRGLDDDFLATDAITALYGTVVGSGLSWSNSSHHVIALLGDGSPEANGFQEDYCVAPFTFNDLAEHIPCDSSDCEPSYHFPSGLSSPQCEGWTSSQDGNPDDSIAALTRTTPTCTQSLGRECTIDVITPYDGITDPFSLAWPTEAKDWGGSPGGPDVLANSDRMLLAACELASATGGSWDGPTFYRCPSGQSGTLQYVPHGSPENPVTSNPNLQSAFTQLGFGSVRYSLVATGASEPIFTFAPYGNIQIAPDPEFQSVCTLADGQFWVGGEKCPAVPVNLTGEQVRYWGWNWSGNVSQNTLSLGDTWSVSFWVEAVGPPYSLVPVDACITQGCAGGGSGPVGGIFSAATYVPETNSSLTVQSFPLASLEVVALPRGIPPSTLPPPAPPAGIPPLPPPPPIPAPLPTAIVAQVPVEVVAGQATVAGFLIGAAVGVNLKNPPIAQAVAALSGKSPSKKSKFEDGVGRSDRSAGRFV
jgi:hypothetical protein